MSLSEISIARSTPAPHPSYQSPPNPEIGQYANSTEYFQCGDGNVLPPLEVVSTLTRLGCELSIEDIARLVEPTANQLQPEEHRELVRAANERVRRQLDILSWFKY